MKSILDLLQCVPTATLRQLESTASSQEILRSNGTASVSTKIELLKAMEVSVAPLTLLSENMSVRKHKTTDAYALHDQLTGGVCGKVDDPGDSP